MIQASFFSAQTLYSQRVNDFKTPAINTYKYLITNTLYLHMEFKMLSFGRCHLVIKKSIIGRNWEKSSYRYINKNISNCSKLILQI